MSELFREHRQLSLPPDHRYVTYCWRSSRKFMLQDLVPKATIIEAVVHDRVEDIVGRMPDDAACFHFHLNCTVTDRFPRARAELMDHLRARGIVPINERVTDISKRAIQRQCAELGLNTVTATRDGDEEELLIVKSDQNYGGRNEWALSAEQRSTLGISGGSEIIRNPDQYLVVPRRAIEASWWTDPGLVFEKYIENTDHRWYRTNVFLSHVVVRELICEHRIKKVGLSTTLRKWTGDARDPGNSGGQAEYPHSLVRDLVRFARAFGVDFAAVDIVVNDDGDLFIIDVNTTPWWIYPDPLGVVEFLRGALFTSSVATESGRSRR